MTTYYIAEIIRILHGSVMPIALLVITMNSLIVTQEYKSWTKRILFTACASIGYTIIGVSVESYMKEAMYSSAGLVNGNVTMEIIELILYAAVYTALTFGWIIGMRAIFGLVRKNNEQT